MKREIIHLEFNDNYHLDDNIPEGFIFIKSEQVDFDSEKGYILETFILQRDSDKKYFKGEFENWGRGVFDYTNELKEVFPKEKIITIFE